MPRIVFSSLLRLSVGYLFLICLFLVVIQESTVLGIFFDVLALEFVENIDDVAFALFQRGMYQYTPVNHVHSGLGAFMRSQWIALSF